MKKRLILLTLFLFQGLCAVTTIEEKLATLEGRHAYEEEIIEVSSSQDVLERLSNLRERLKEKYESCKGLVENGAEEEEYGELLEEINFLKQELSAFENKWRSLQAEEIQNDTEAFGLWEHEDASVAELVMEYGSTEHLYIVPPEIAQIKLQVHSALLIPRESWSSLLEAIFKHSGIGVKEINSYAKQLYLLKQDYISFGAILTSKDQLALFDEKDRVGFIYSPPVDQLRQAFYFIERFRDPKTTFVYQVGAKIAIIGYQDDVRRLITLCENVWEKGEEKIIRVVTSSKIQTDEVVKLLKSYFGSLSEASRAVGPIKGGHDLSVTALSHESGVILMGSKSLVDKAERIIREAESQVSDPSELTIFWHTCSHSNPTDLAEILDRVYASLIHSSMEIPLDEGPLSHDPSFPPRVASDFDDDDDGPYPPNVQKVKPWSTRPQRQKVRQPRDDEYVEERERSGNFIPYPSTGSILMVIRKDMVGKIKEVIKRLDIPKRMVEIEVLLVERRIKNSSRSGINILRLGSTANNVNKIGVEYSGGNTDKSSKGLFEFIFSGCKTEHFPAIDLCYNFLLAQDDIRVTAAPSVVTINQSPAIIAVTDQISINNGASPIETNKGFVFKDSFERADFGITIKLTPTVHEPELNDPDEGLFVTLENDISFETIKRGEGGNNHQPDVHKRQVKNHVRIADGQTVILGGLKNKSQEDKNDRIPFLGEIPGFGKLFGTSLLTDSSAEMFIFIRPRVIHDPKKDLVRLRDEQLKGRPGDSQVFLDKISESRKRSSERLFKRSYELLFGTREDGTVNL